MSRAAADQDEMRVALIDRYGDQLSQEQLAALSGGVDVQDVFAGVFAGLIVVGAAGAAI